MRQDTLYYTELPDGELAFAKAPQKADAIKVFQGRGIYVMGCMNVWLVFDKAAMRRKKMGKAVEVK